MKQKKRIAIIPARSGSKRIKNKNTKLFLNSPIINITLKEILKTKIFDIVHVSTESEKIKKTVQKTGIKIDFMRPKKLAGDNVPLADVVNHCISEYSKRNIFFSEVWLIFSTAVLFDNYEIKKAVNYFKNKKIKNLLSVARYPAPIEWAQIVKKNILYPVNKNKIYSPAKKFKNTYYETATFVAYKLENNATSLKKNLVYTPYEISPFKGIDIDDMNDWKNALTNYKLIFNK